MRHCSVLVLVLVLVALALVGGCSSSQSYSYNFKSNKFYDQRMGTLSIQTVPPNARVYAKSRYRGTGDMHTPHGDHSQDFSDQIQHDLKDWTLIGTTPLAEFKVLLYGKSTDRHFTSSATWTMQLEDFSLRIEKEGYNTLELPHVGVTTGKTTLNLELAPAPTTRPVQSARP